MPSARKDDKSDTLIRKRAFEQRCAIFSELPLLHVSKSMRNEVFPMVFDAMEALARDCQAEMLVWEGIRDSLFGRIPFLDLASLSALEAVIREWSTWSDLCTVAARTHVGWGMAYGDEEFRAVNLAQAAAAGHPCCLRLYRKGGKKFASMHRED